MKLPWQTVFQEWLDILLQTFYTFFTSFVRVKQTKFAKFLCIIWGSRWFVELIGCVSGRLITQCFRRACTETTEWPELKFCMEVHFGTRVMSIYFSNNSVSNKNEYKSRGKAWRVCLRDIHSYLATLQQTVWLLLQVSLYLSDRGCQVSRHCLATRKAVKVES